MKHLTTMMILAVLFLFAVGSSPGQGTGGDKITVPLTDPSKPVQLKISLMNGSIDVKGYSGKEVIVEGRSLDSSDEDEEDARDDEKMSKRRGMRRITGGGAGLSVEEDHNEVTIGTGWRHMGAPMAVTVQVPVNTSMKLSTMNDGDIKVTGVTGDLELSNMNGGIDIRDITGSVVADALNDEIKVVFTSVDPKKSMSFSSMNGDIDVTLPASVKATLKLKNDMGEIYSDFDMKLDNSTSRVEEGKKGKRGKYKVSLEKIMTGTINGGGAELNFKNFNGDIYIRKGK